MRSISPKDEREVADVVRGATVPMEIVSGGSKRTLGRPVEAAILLDLRALTGILNYDPEELVLTVRAGTPLGEIAAAVEKRRQMLAFAPADWGPVLGNEPGRATLAGTVGANACGSRRVKAGAVRDHLIGCRFVNGDGEIVAAGGKVVKNVTGFDVPKLMCGAFGTLGVLTELTFRVVPKPERAPALALNCPPALGLAALRRAAALPVEASGLAYLPHTVAPVLFKGFAGNSGTAIIRVEGSTAAVGEKLARLRDIFPEFECNELTDDEADDLFCAIGSGAPFTGVETDIWRLAVPEASASDALKMAGAELWYADWAGGMLWLGLPAAVETAEKLRRVTQWHGGHATLFRAGTEARTRLRVFEPEPAARAILTASVKAAFDPKHILNRGRMAEGL